MLKKSTQNARTRCDRCRMRLAALRRPKDLGARGRPTSATSAAWPALMQQKFRSSRVPGGRPGSKEVELFGRRVAGGAVVAPYFRVSAPARESTFLPSVLLRAPWHALPLFCRSAHPSGASSFAATPFERAPADSTTSAHFFGLHRVYAPRGPPRKVFRVQIPRH